MRKAHIFIAMAACSFAFGCRNIVKNSEDEDLSGPSAATQPTKSSIEEFTAKLADPLGDAAQFDPITQRFFRLCNRKVDPGDPDSKSMQIGIDFDFKIHEPTGIPQGQELKPTIRDAEIKIFGGKSGFGLVGTSHSWRAYPIPSTDLDKVLRESLASLSIRCADTFELIDATPKKKSESSVTQHRTTSYIAEGPDHQLVVVRPERIADGRYLIHVYVDPPGKSTVGDKLLDRIEERLKAPIPAKAG